MRRARIFFSPLFLRAAVPPTELARVRSGRSPADEKILLLEAAKAVLNEERRRLFCEMVFETFFAAASGIEKMIEKLTLSFQGVNTEVQHVTFISNHNDSI